MPEVVARLGWPDLRRLAGVSVRDARVAVVGLTLPVIGLHLLMAWVQHRKGGWLLLTGLAFDLIATLAAFFVIGFIVSFIWRIRRLRNGLRTLAREQV